jgi:NADH-quinone oxidoreductase subunit C
MPAAPPPPTPKTTEKPSDTGAGKPADDAAHAQARKPSSAKAASEVSKASGQAAPKRVPARPRKPKGDA